MTCRIAFLLLALTSMTIGALDVPISPEKNGVHRRIVGGRDANISEFPHQVALLLNGRPWCGASIISATFVLSAAHCTEGHPAKSFSVRAGSSSAVSGGQVVQVLAINNHPEYHRLDFDISILEVEPLELNNTARPVTLPNKSELSDGTTVQVTGWGLLRSGVPSPKQLQAVDVKIINREKCKKSYDSGYFKISERMVCAGVDYGGKDSCQGDSGGPLVYNGVQYGIVSFGEGCGLAQYPGVYSNVVALRSFITKITNL